MRLRFGAVVVASAALLAATTASAQTLALATDRPGTTFNAMGSGLAKVIGDGSDVRAVVRPFAGPDAYIAALNDGELDLAAISSTSAYRGARGEAPKGKPLVNLRILRSGERGLMLSFIATRESGIKAVKDIRGKRVCGHFGGHSAIVESVEATLATAGLGWNDVVQVPVTGAVNGIEAMGAGRVDACWASFGMPVVRELHAKSPIRYVAIENSPAALETLRKGIFPGAKLTTVETDPRIGVDEPTTMITYDSYLLAHAGVRAEVVRKILAALWDREQELIAIHPSLKGFTNKAAVSDLPVVPYHPAAIAFYREKGVWTPEADALNARAGQ